LKIHEKFIFDNLILGVIIRKLKTSYMKKSIYLILVTALMVLFTGCNKTTDNGMGRLSIRITDGPFPMSSVESATVTITKVELRKAGDGVSDGNPFLVAWEGSATFDLLDLRNGVTQDLVGLDLPQGTYDLVRLYVEEAGLKIMDGGDFSVKVPSGKQTGIKIFINPALEVAGGLTEELLLDFDLSQSFVMRGNMHSPHGINGFIFKPVIRAVNNSTAGRLEGLVTDTASVKIKEARIYAKLDTTIVKAVADTMGHYAIIGLPSGLYQVSAVQENFDSVVVDDVRISSGNRTVLDFKLPPKE